MAPIAVALIGLSASSKVSWAADAHLPYLLSARGREKYTIVALLNSSTERAEAARTHFGLPDTVRAYGSPADLAADPAVELVVCSTRVDTHYDVTLPSVRAGKAAFVEWPLANSSAKARELRNAASAPSIVGLQGRASPVTVKVKELLAEGIIGRVLSSNVRAYGSGLPRDSIPDGVEYLLDRNISGNAGLIQFGHLIDLVHDTLGEFETFESTMQIQRPQVSVLKDWGRGAKTAELMSNVPDLIAMSGRLGGHQGSKRPYAAEGATLAVSYRNGPPFPGDQGLSWNINGETGELRINAVSPHLQGHGADAPVTIEHHDLASDKVEEIEWNWEEWQEGLPKLTKITAKLYENFAAWKIGEPGGGAQGVDWQAQWPSFGDAVERHEEFDRMYKAFDAASK